MSATAERAAAEDGAEGGATGGAEGEASRGRARGGGPARAALATAVLGFFVISLDVSAVNVALPAIRSGLGGGMTGLQWVVDGYTLMFAALMLSAGALSDRVGARRAYGWGMALFTFASVCCGAAPGLGALLAARVVQGAAAAAMMPASLALIRQAYPDPRRRARAVALWTVGGAVAVAGGPALGGLLATVWDWRAVFLLNVPVGGAALALLPRTPRSPRRPAPFDPAGQALAVLAPAALTYAVIEGGSAGFLDGPVPVVALVGVAAAAAFLAVQARRAEPMVPLGLFRRRTVAVPVAAGFAANLGFYGGIFLLGLFFQQERGWPALSAGLMFAPMALLTAAMNMVSPRLAARFGPRAPVVAGQLLLAGALFTLLLAGDRTPAPVLALLLLPVGAGGALAVPALTSMMLDSVEAHRAGTAAAVLNTARQMGGALGVAVFGALLSGGAFMAGMRESLLVGGGLLAATGVLSYALLPRRASTETAAVTADR